MKYTLLEIVVDIMNDMDSDLVNSIDDTFESQQVAQIVKTTFFEMIGNRNWPHLNKALVLDSSNDPNYPTHMSVTQSLKELSFINYDVRTSEDDKRDYKQMKWKDPDDFLLYINRRNSDNDNVEIIKDYSGVELLIFNDAPPTYYTSFDDDKIIFDSYDSSMGATLLSAKTQAKGYINPTWSHADNAVPDLPIEAFPALIAEAKSVAFNALKQMENGKAEQQSRRQQAWLSQKAWKIKGGLQYPNYGRKRRSYPSQPLRKT